MKRIVMMILVLLLLPAVLMSASPKVAVVLSGGGARGIAHVAILEALEEYGIPVDMVIGTSMGALIGGLYAAGYSPGDIKALFSDQENLMSLFSDMPSTGKAEIRKAFSDPAGLLVTVGFGKDGIGSVPGLISDQRVLSLLDALLAKIPVSTDFDDLVVPFRCVGTDAYSGDRIVYDSGGLVRAIRSSISIPVVFPPYPQGDGRYAMDGGLVDNMPVQLARNLGADIVIACDVNAKQRLPEKELDSLTAVANQSILLATQGKVIAQYPLADLIIFPEVKDIQTLDFNRYDEIIRIGEDACKANARALSSMAAQIQLSRKLVPRDPDRKGAYFSLPDLEISAIRIDDQSLVKAHDVPHPRSFASFVGRDLDAQTRHELELAIERMKNNYGLSSAGYQFESDEDGRGILTIHIRRYAGFSSSVGISFSGTLGISSNTPNAVGWALPVLTLDGSFSQVFDSEFSIGVRAVFGQTMGLGLSTGYPFFSSRNTSLDLSVGFFYANGAVTPLNTTVNGNRTASLDRDAVFDLGLSLHFFDSGRADFGGRIRFADLHAEPYDPHFLAMPSLYGALVWDTIGSTFATSGIRAEGAVTLGYMEQSVFSVGVAFRQAFAVGDDSLSYALRGEVLRLPYQFLDSYGEFGALEGMPGYSSGSLKRDIALISVQWQHPLDEKELSMPIYLLVTGAIGTADGYDPYAGVAPVSDALFADCIGFEGGVSIGLGVDTPLGAFKARIGVGLHGDIAFILGVS